jgi:hypothetical protein
VQTQEDNNMTFFYDLNKTLDAIREKPELKHGQLNERDMGKHNNATTGFKALANKAGGGEKGEKIAGAQFQKMKKAGQLEEQGMEEGIYQGRPDKSQIPAVQRKNDPLTLQDLEKERTQSPTTAVGMRALQDKLSKIHPLDEKLSDAQSSDFAALAPPKDKITFADKIAGAKKEVDEMLGDVAAEAMKNALSGGQKKLDKNNNGKLDANDFAMLRKGGKKVADESKDDNNPFTSWKKPRAEKPKVGSVERGALHDIEHTATGRKVTRRVDQNTGHSVGSDDDTPASGEKRGRGRPAGKGAGKSIGAKGPSGKSKLMTREEIDEAIAALEECGYSVSPLEEKAVSKKQQKFMGMVHSAQKGEKPASKEVAKVAKTMKKGDAEDFASTKHKGLPEKKAKKEEVEETTTSGSVATAPAEGGKKAKGGMQFGKGVYESLDKQFQKLLNEEMTINVNMGPDGQKSISVTATEADADQLAQLLNLAGMQGNDHSSCPTCGQAPCGCAGQVDENSPDWPTDQETIDNDDAHLRKFSGGLNGPKSTGQATVPVLASQLNRQRTMEDTVQLERKLFDLYKNYKTK